MPKAVTQSIVSLLVCGGPLVCIGRNATFLAALLLVLSGCGSGDKPANKPTDVQADIDLPDVGLTDAGALDLVLSDLELSCPGNSGCPCTEESDCFTSLCVEADVGRVCATLCSQTCPVGTRCISNPKSESTSYCAPATVRQCAPCRTDDDCNSPLSVPTRCVSAGAVGSFCAPTCAVSQDCTTGFACVASSGGNKTCQPSGGITSCSCSTWAIAAKADTACEVAEGTQLCPGSRQCGPQGLSECSKLAGEACIDAGCKDAKDGSACDDGDPCTQSECQTGVCKATTNFCQCQSDGDCGDDTNLCNGKPFCDKAAVPYTCKANPATVVNCGAADEPCKALVCQPVTGKCEAEPADEGKACTDGDPCFANKTCQAGQCQGGLQTCSCVQTSDCAGQENSNLCDGTLYCDLVSHTCKVNPVTVVQCQQSGKSCEVTSCLPATGQCVTAAKPDTAACEDGAACTIGDYCQAGQCIPGTVTCDCAADADCAGYEDGNGCNGKLFCNKAVGKCQVNPKTVVQCPSGLNTECQINSCDPTTGACALSLQPTTTLCEDGNPCSGSDHCDGLGKCSSSVDICPCDNDADCAGKEDGNLCNGTLYCELTSKTCQLNPASVVHCPWAGDNPCSPIQCQPQTGECQPTVLTKGSCDDGDPCTALGLCQAGTCVAGPNLCQCQSAADCGPFDDGNPCNGTYYCDVQNGQCKPNPASIPNCPSSLGDCVSYACSPQSGQCEAVPAADGDWCNDGEPCSKSDSCLGGSCKGGSLVCACLVDGDCAGQEDDNLCNGTLICDRSEGVPQCVVNPLSIVTCSSDTPCLEATCAPETGKCATEPVSGPCSDGSACTVGDSCAGGVCLPGPATACDDQNVCTDDSCSPASGCGFLANAATCSDGDVCTVGDGCAGGVCLAGAVTVCDDQNVCTDDSCSPTTGCDFEANTAPCSDGSVCTENDLCANASCKPGAAKDCDDGKVCSDDLCDPASGCKGIANAASCSDGNACTVDDVCAGLSCKPGVAKVCDDGQVCTDDSCEPATGCVFGDNTASCSDGSACTENDQCGGGSCQQGPTKECDDGKVCTDDSCTPESGCVFAPNTKPCSDGSACTENDQCANGTCLQGTVTECTDNNPCTDDSCDPVSGCVFATNAVGCDDDDACTTNDGCDSGACSGTQLVCDDDKVCTSNGCDPTLGCIFTSNSGAQCTAGSCVDLLFTKPSTCAGETCVEQGTTNCNDSNACTDDFCSPSAGCSNVPNGIACDDGDACTNSDTCSAAGCAGTPLDCDDGTPCTVDSCSGGTCGHAPACIDNDNYTSDLCDPVDGSCSFPAIEACNGKDDDGDGTTDNVVCGGSACTCIGGVTACQAGCTACPNYDDVAIAIDDNGVSKVICAPDQPTWPIELEAPDSLTAGSNGTVLDSRTGLQWQATTDGQLHTWQAAQTACDELVLDDQHDWRLPTTAELHSLVDYTKATTPQIDVALFANTLPNAYYWTAVPYQGGTVQTWAVRFGDGTSSGFTVGSAIPARCVRTITTQAVPGLRWTADLANGTVLDSRRGLVWQRQPPTTGGNGNGAYNWSGAKQYCQDLNLAGRDDWRLPTLRELRTVSDRQKTTAPAIDLGAFSTPPTSGTAGYWTNTAYQAGLTAGLAMNVNTGITFSDSGNSSYRVRCVRAPVCGDGTCEGAEDTTCLADCSCTPALEGAACDDENACTTGDVCNAGLCTAGELAVCDTDYMLATCDPTKGCVGKEICNGLDDDGNGSTDDVLCDGSACTCLPNGSSECGTGCTACPNYHDVAIPIDDGGTQKVICAPDYHPWGEVPDAPDSLMALNADVVADSRTGLEWQRSPGSTTYTWESAVAHCDSLVLDGKTDWRAPTFTELESIVDYGTATAPAIDVGLFADTLNTEYWTWISDSALPKRWFIRFMTGYGWQQDTTTPDSIRCVRTGTTGAMLDARPTPRWFVDLDGATVLDRWTTRVWQRQPPTTGGSSGLTDGRFNWSDAKQYCQDLVLGGHDDWRLPKLQELRRLLDRKRSGQPISQVAFPNTPISGKADYWSATPYRSGTSFAWLVYFSYGPVYDVDGVNNNYRVRCVR